ncbi:hypothetical protein KH5H1_25490 [Corallococcus caeni]|nr:hypothetical protein KH5H1_25490 [Corallococcus sp. KH5-1]
MLIDGDKELGFLLQVLMKGASSPSRRVQWLSCANGDDLQALIEKDNVARKEPQCAHAGGSTGTKSVYRDAKPP